MTDAAALEIRPLTPDRWDDLADLFERPGPRGGWPRTAACYCMFWRLEPDVYERSFRERSLTGTSGGPNKEAMAGIVGAGGVPGLLAYRGGVSVGWVAVSPRHELTRLGSVGTLAVPAAAGDVWAISCFYVYRSEWRRGVASALLDAAVATAIEHGAAAVDAYPVKAGSIDPYTGYDIMFARAGFSVQKPGRGLGRAVWRLDL